MTALCRDNQFDGIQFDFENVHVSDKDAFTAFVEGGRRLAACASDARFRRRWCRA